MKHLNNYILIMHLLKVPLEGLTSSCFLNAKSTPIFSIQVDGFEMEFFVIHISVWVGSHIHCIHGSLAGV